MKKIFSILIILLIICGCRNSKSNKITIVTTNFPSYDFVRSITKNSDIEVKMLLKPGMEMHGYEPTPQDISITKNSDIEVKMLLKPGMEMHGYEPTPQDIIDINNSKLFIYVGGESDSWIDDVLQDINTDNKKIIKLMDLVDLCDEEIKDGMDIEEEDKESDEHVWTSPMNAIKIIDSLKEEIKDIDPDNSSLYEDNANNYIDEIKEIDSEIRDIVKNSKRKELIFGDRFPLLYFVKEYNLDYYAAFPGCSEQTEASAKTISFLIDKVKSDNIPVIFHIELSNSKIADTIASETGTKVLKFNSAHNITKDEFDKGVTYVDLMKDNIKVLKEALN